MSASCKGDVPTTRRSCLGKTLLVLCTQAAAWIQEDSCPEYMLKAEECLRAEEERVNNYLHQSSKTKLLEQARA